MRLPRPSLYPILDQAQLISRGLEAGEVLERWRRHGMAYYQYRAKGMSSEEYLSECRRLKRLSPEMALIANDHLNAVLAQSDLFAGLHIGQEDLAALNSTARSELVGLTRRRLICGISTHNSAEMTIALAALQAEESMRIVWHYIAIGPLATTGSKKEGLSAPLSSADLEELLALFNRTPLPVERPALAFIGGLTAANLAELLPRELCRHYGVEPLIAVIGSALEQKPLQALLKCVDTTYRSVRQVDHPSAEVSETMRPTSYRAGSASVHDDRDYILEYMSLDLDSLNRINILDVPIDNVSRDEAVAVIMDLIEKKEGPFHVFLADPVKLMAIRPKRKNGYIARQARLILAEGCGIVWASEKLGEPLKERISAIALIMDLVRMSVKKDFTIYLLGSHQEHVEKVFFNLQRSFPGVRVVGRQSGFFKKNREQLIKESLRKSSPDIVLLGMGFGRQERWLRDNKEYLSRAVVIGVDGALDTLSGQVRKAPDWMQVRGLVWLWRILSRPWRIVRLSRAISFYSRTLWRSLRGRNADPAASPELL